ncbi:MAG TPA: hypothetical protein VF407_17060, partial [Polyangiaceae bacterium]
MRAAYVLGLSVAAGALVFACAKGDASSPDGGTGDGDDFDAGSSTGEDGSVNYFGDSGPKDGGGSESDADIVD